jgi:processive 1,2-diacylglycerol beta-glucosyltransferase
LPLSKRVLFCYITPFSGHQKAAEAVMTAMRRLNPRVETQGINSVSYATPFLGKVVSRVYLQILKHAPQVWDFLYDNPQVEEATRDLRRLLHMVNTRKIFKLIREYRPRCLVCTQAIPVGILSALKQRGKLNLPLVGVVTDFGVHGYWLSRHVDLYLVPTEEIRRALIRRGIRESRVRVTGIPTDPVFAVKGQPTVERERLGLRPDRPTVLVMGGSYGLGALEQVLAALRSLPASPQVVAVCGSNRRLWRRLHDRFASDRAVRLFGPTRGVSRLMEAADVLISKPGGLTSAEALVKGLPFVMINPIPGQEERNARYLLRHGAAARADTMEELTDTVGTLLTDERRREKLSENALALARPRAAYDAAEAVLRLIGEPVIHPFRGVAREAAWV